MPHWFRLIVCFGAGLTAAWFGVHYEEQLNNPVGFIVLLLGPVLFGLAMSVPQIGERAATYGFASAVAAAIALGSALAGRGEEGGLLVLVVASAVLLTVMSMARLGLAVAISILRSARGGRASGP